ncbi:MAG: hypothetical protein ACRENN_09070, partial [Candidatus Eiseniibacteriota bacterium]
MNAIVRGVVPVPANLLGYAAIRERPGGDHLEIRGAVVFGGLRAELSFGTRDDVGCRGIVATSVAVLPAGVICPMDLEVVVPPAAAAPSVWLQLTDADEHPITEAIRLGAVTSKPQPFTFREVPLLSATAWIAARDGAHHELVGEMMVGRGVMLSIRIATGGPRHAFPAESSAAVHVTLPTRNIPLSTVLPWTGNPLFRLASILLVD